MRTSTTHNSYHGSLASPTLLHRHHLAPARPGDDALNVDDQDLGNIKYPNAGSD